jgi:DNA-binding NarL/FixJ family response regulator
MELVAEADTPEAAMEVLARNPADLVLLDLSLSRLDGFELLKHIRRVSGHLKVLVLSMYKLEEVAETAFAAGADGYCTKETGRDGLLSAMAEVMAGRRVCCLEAW